MIKTKVFEVLVRRAPLLHRPQVALSTAATQPELDNKIFQSFRTTENDPRNHSPDHLGQFYRVSSSDKQRLFASGGLPRSFDVQCKTFNETCIMVRKPALDIINCLKAIDYSKPAVRFVLYGKKGSGRSLSLAHVLHYSWKSDFLVVHVPWVGNWMRRCKESSNSESKEGFIDLNIDAAAWLLHFKMQNEHLLGNPEFRTARDYVWSKRETTPKDVSLIEVIDHGVNRIKYASDCVVVLAEEIKRLTRAGHCKTLVAIDGFNAFFYPNTRIYTEKKEVVHPDKVVLTEAFRNLTRFDWRNAAIVVVVDEIAIAESDQKSHLPRYLLGKAGFEHLDPFVPVPVHNYTTKELTSCMDYYRDRKWVTPHPGQDEEIAFISSSNPYTIMTMCSGL